MIDILEKLQRGTRRDARGNWYQSDIDIEAELEIEELREQLEIWKANAETNLSEVDHLRAALEAIVDYDFGVNSTDGKLCQDIAREALDSAGAIGEKNGEPESRTARGD
jgi:hypothetical protein